LFQSYIQREGFSDTDSWQSEWKAESWMNLDNK
jgi:hypothetical protein